MVCVALVSAYVLGESVSARQLVGYGVLIVAIILIFAPREREAHREDGES